MIRRFVRGPNAHGCARKIIARHEKKKRQSAVVGLPSGVPGSKLTVDLGSFASQDVVVEELIFSLLVRPEHVALAPSRNENHVKDNLKNARVLGAAEAVSSLHRETRPCARIIALKETATFQFPDQRPPPFIHGQVEGAFKRKPVTAATQEQSNRPTTHKKDDKKQKKEKEERGPTTHDDKKRRTSDGQNARKKNAI